MTVFLWHITAAILVLAALHFAGVSAPGVDSIAWYAWRIPYLSMFSIMLALLVAIFGPIEVRDTLRRNRLPSRIPLCLARAASRPAPRLALAVAGFAGVTSGVLGNSMSSSTSPTLLGWPAQALITYLAGAAALRFLRATAPAASSHPG